MEELPYRVAERWLARAGGRQLDANRRLWQSYHTGAWHPLETRTSGTREASQGSSFLFPVPSLRNYSLSYLILCPVVGESAEEAALDESAQPRIDAYTSVGDG
jgi:hypothetical protein